MSVNHHRDGAGEPLVLLHGIGLSWQIFAPVIAPLAREFDVIACDSPGFGRSAPLPAGVKPTISAYADAFERFFAEQGLERPHAAGNSMGGAIALELARRGAVRSVTAISPAGFWTPRERRFCQLSLASFAHTRRAALPALEALARTRLGRLVLLWQTFGRPLNVPVPALQEMLHAAWAAPAFAPALSAFDEYTFGAGEQLERAGVPVTIAWGVHDRLLPYATQAPRARALLPHARHVTLGVGHVPFYDDPPVIVETIRAGAGASEHAPGRARARAAAVPGGPAQAPAGGPIAAAAGPNAST
jgi:pimeloyl-ACP methyl ester carboxylesterase